MDIQSKIDWRAGSRWHAHPVPRPCKYLVIVHKQLDVALETCGVCGEQVPFSNTVHILVHTKSDAGVIDQYICRDCYEAEIAPLFETRSEPSL